MTAPLGPRELAVVDCLEAAGEQGASIVEIADALGVGRNAAACALRGAVDEGYQLVNVLAADPRWTTADGSRYVLYSRPGEPAPPHVCLWRECDMVISRYSRTGCCAAHESELYRRRALALQRRLIERDREASRREREREAAARGVQMRLVEVA